jgi:hypothetical protein
VFVLGDLRAAAATAQPLDLGDRLRGHDDPAPAAGRARAPQNFIESDREQELVLPPSLRDWLPDDHLAWFVADAVEEIDLAAFYGAYRADGRGPATVPRGAFQRATHDHAQALKQSARAT